MDYLLHIAILSSIYSLAVLGQNYASGYTGLISINHGAFMGIGAYAGAILLKWYGVPFPVAFLAAGAATGLAAWLLSFPLLKLKGDSFVLVSFGFSFIAFNLFLNWRGLTNGALGLKAIPGPELVNLLDNTKIIFLAILLALILITLWGLHKILQSSYGVVIRATRENQKVTQIAGHCTDSYRRSVFVLSGVITGIAGLFLASYISTIDPTLFNYHLSVLLLIMAILGGLASLKGSIAGATLLIVLPELLRFLGLPNSILAESQQISYGLILILLMYYRPVGLFGTYKI
ncbi:MAG: branched-chain amino acid ABC transporter permease [bacterium]|nr:branched-chain amino acid ABC transporter permease [bacterium]